MKMRKIKIQEGNRRPLHSRLDCYPKLIVLSSAIVVLLLVVALVNTLSISANNKNVLVTNKNVNDKSQASQQATPEPQQTNYQSTEFPSLMLTTVSQYNFLESVPSKSHQGMSNFKSVNLSNVEYVRTNYEDTEDSMAMATVNNHSGNNNGPFYNNNNNNNLRSPAKPPQYVDVSALVGRNSNFTSLPHLNGHSNNVIPSNTSSSGLSPKSRFSLPECATQQVCNAIFVRMNYTQKLCECSSNFNWQCSNNLDPQDGHTIELTRRFDKRIYTQIKTCEPLREVRACKSPTDWTLLALQSERSGKAHYVVICKCPTWAQLEGPYTHNHPPYANMPGIRVYGMLCVHQTARSSAQTYSTYNPSLNAYPEFPWSEALSVANTTDLLAVLDSH